MTTTKHLQWLLRNIGLNTELWEGHGKFVPRKRSLGRGSCPRGFRLLAINLLSRQRGRRQHGFRLCQPEVIKQPSMVVELKSLAEVRPIPARQTANSDSGRAAGESNRSSQ